MLCSLVVDKLGSSGGTLSDLTVTAWLVGHRVLSDVVSDHVRFDFDQIPVLSGVDFSDAADHVGHNDSITQVGLHRFWLLSMRTNFGSMSKLLGKPVVAWEDTFAESPSLSGPEHSDHMFSGQLEKLFKLDASVDLFFEWFSSSSSLACFSLGSLKSFFGS